MDDREQFLIKASQLFTDNGAKGATMDDIAATLGISKKTIYRMFRNKEELLEKTLWYNLEKMIARLKFLDETIDNAVERMFCGVQELERIAQSHQTLLTRQLVKYYPAIFSKHMQNFCEKFSEVLIHNIEKGRRQGDYRQDFDAVVYSKIFFQLVLSYGNSPFLETATIDRDHYKNELMMMYVNAIVTQQGKETIKKIKKQ